MSDYCKKDNNGNYIDIITDETIDKDNLIKFTQNGIEYCFDYKTLYKYKKETKKYMNPFTRQVLPTDVIDEIKIKLEQNSYKVIIEYYKNVKLRSSIRFQNNEKTLALFQLIEKIASLLSGKLDIKDILISKIIIRVNNKIVNLSTNIKLDNTTIIVLKPPKSIKRATERINDIKKLLNGNYKIDISNIKGRLNSYSKDLLKALKTFIYTDTLQIMHERIIAEYGYYIYLLMYNKNLEGFRFLINTNTFSYANLIYDILYNAFKNDLVELIISSNNPEFTNNMIIFNSLFRTNISKYMEGYYDIINEDFLNGTLLLLSNLSKTNNRFLIDNFFNKDFYINFLIKKEYNVMLFTVYNIFKEMDVKNEKLNEYVNSIL